jgi:hypothetical protein
MLHVCVWFPFHFYFCCFSEHNCHFTSFLIMFILEFLNA